MSKVHRIFHGVIVPKEVLYDSSISSFSKLIYGELLFLKTTQSEPGDLRVDSGQLAEKYGEEKEVVDAALNELVNANHLTSLEVLDGR